jgi:hypothetical protein
MRKVWVLVAVAAFGLAVTSCQVGVTMWGACSSAPGVDPFGVDGQYVVHCESGKWKPIMTVAEYLKLLQHKPFTIGPLPTEPTTTTSTTTTSTTTTSTTTTSTTTTSVPDCGVCSTSMVHVTTWRGTYSGWTGALPDSADLWVDPPFVTAPGSSSNCSANAIGIPAEFGPSDVQAELVGGTLHITLTLVWKEALSGLTTKSSCAPMPTVPGYVWNSASPPAMLPVVNFNDNSDVITEIDQIG